MFFFFTKFRSFYKSDQVSVSIICGFKLFVGCAVGVSSELMHVYISCRLAPKTLHGLLFGQYSST